VDQAMARLIEVLAAHYPEYLAWIEAHPGKQLETPEDEYRRLVEVMDATADLLTRTLSEAKTDAAIAATWSNGLSLMLGLGVWLAERGLVKTANGKGWPR
jgi:hypothetical protein